MGLPQNWETSVFPWFIKFFTMFPIPNKSMAVVSPSRSHVNHPSRAGALPNFRATPASRVQFEGEGWGLWEGSAPMKSTCSVKVSASPRFSADGNGAQHGATQECCRPRCHKPSQISSMRGFTQAEPILLALMASHYLATLHLPLSLYFKPH